MELKEQALKLGLTANEFERIKEILQREPSFTELAMYSVMWSEHCSYKNSIKYLKKLPKKGKKVLAEAGEENAGLIDIGDGWACSFKIESHNHPSAIEPFQGAATGVGGIHRDIFTMGARPIASLNSLRFGSLDSAKTQHLMKGVVSGIGHYGNCFGVPTVGGEVYFEKCYSTNPLVNAMSVGIVKHDKTISAISYGAGNPVFIVGAYTGKDGIGGASFASADITKDSAEQLPAVQVGDPFEEKKLLEACMELSETDFIVGMQDMGAAGITCSSSEMSAKGKHGMDIWLDKVPTRQKNMEAWEMLLSESQERMLVVITKGNEDKLRSIFEKWDIHCVQIGEVTDSPLINYYMGEELMGSVPAESMVLGGGAPVYDREFREPAYFKDIAAFDSKNIDESLDLKSDAKKIIQLPNIASKRWIYEQYDSMVGTANTQTNAPSDAPIVWVKETNIGIAMTVDCNSRYVRSNPEVGGMIAVSEAARNIVCSGGTPSAITNCLNFGNPYNPEVYYQFVYALQGMSNACIKFETPVTGGNVSFYNQWEEGPVYPTPTIGMVGILDSMDHKMTLNFKQNGDVIYLIGKHEMDINSSEYLTHIKGVELSPAPYFNLEEEYSMQQKVLELIHAKKINAAHDISEGGLFVCLAEMGFTSQKGFNISLMENYRKDAQLFGEAQGRVVVTVSENQVEEFEKSMQNIPFSKIGKVTDREIVVDKDSWGEITEWYAYYDSVISSKMNTSIN